MNKSGILFVIIVLIISCNQQTKTNVVGGRNSRFHYKDNFTAFFSAAIPNVDYYDFKENRWITMEEQLPVIIAIATLIICSFMGCNSSDNLLSVSINTKSNSKAIGTKVTVENCDKNTKLVSISITNNGDKTEVIQDIQIRLTNTPVFNEKSKFLYGSYEMSSKTPVQLRNFKRSSLAVHRYLALTLATSMVFAPVPISTPVLKYTFDS